MSQDTRCITTLGKQRSRLENKHNSNDGMKDIEQMTTNLGSRDVVRMKKGKS